MNVCFHGGAGDSKVARSISVIGAFTKNMKAMSLKAKAGAGGGSHPRAWRRARRPEAGGLQRQPQDYKDGSGGAVNASAKIAPAQLQEKADDEHRHDRQLSKGAEEQGGGGKKQEYCDKCCSPLLGDDGTAGEEEEVAGAAAEEERVREWVAEPEPGVLMTLAPRPDGTNRLRRMRFREELFDAWAAQSWWADNYDRIVELYSVVQSDDDDDDDAAAAAGLPVTPCQSEEEEEEWTTTGAKSVSPSTSNFSGEPSSGSGSGSTGTVGSPILGLVAAPDTLSGSKPTATTTGIKAAAAQHDDDGIRDQTRTPWREWVEEYEAGVFITVRAYPELRHVELSRERFGEVKARVWWQENKDKLRSLYSF